MAAMMEMAEVHVLTSEKYSVEKTERKRKEKPEIGIVVATSGTYNFHSDKLVPSALQEGDKVLIPKLGSLRITVEGDEYYITKEQDVYSKFN